MARYRCVDIMTLSQNTYAQVFGRQMFNTKQRRSESVGLLISDILSKYLKLISHTNTLYKSQAFNFWQHWIDTISLATP